MLNISHLKHFGLSLQAIYRPGKFLFSSYAVREVRADYLMIVEDKAG